MLNRIGLPPPLKAVIWHQVPYSKFLGKNNNPVRIVLYCLKRIKNVLLVSTTHSEPDVCEKAYKKPRY